MQPVPLPPTPIPHFEVSPKPKRHHEFHLNGRHWWLTFSQTSDFGDSLEDLSDILGYHFAYLPPLAYYIACAERHLDGHRHYHVYFMTVKGLDIYSQDHFDWMYDQHPEIRLIGARDKVRIHNTIEYCKKTLNFVEDGVNPCLKVEKPYSIAVRMLKDGATLEQLEDWNPSFFISRDHQLQRAWARYHSRQYIPAVWKPLPVGDFYEYDVGNLIAQWLNLNLCQPDRSPRERNLWIYGPSGFGKTELARSLSKRVSVINAVSGVWFSSYTDACDLVVFNDFSGHDKTADFMKRFCEGYPFDVPRKGASDYQKKKHVPVLVISNPHPSHVYRGVYADNRSSYDALIDRFEILCVDKPFWLFPEDPIVPRRARLNEQFVHPELPPHDVYDTGIPRHDWPQPNLKPLVNQLTRIEQRIKANGGRPKPATAEQLAAMNAHVRGKSNFNLSQGNF